MGTITIQGQGAIDAWVLLSRMHQLALEINTSMRHSAGPILKIMHREGWLEKPMLGTVTNKRAVLRAAVDLYTERVNPDYEPEPATIGRALCCQGQCFCRTPDSVPVEPEHCDKHCRRFS